MANGSFYQNGLPISSVETGVGNLPTTHPPANPASSSFYLSGSVYQTLANQDALLATITADTALVVTDLGLANTAASNAAASAAAAAATLASALLIANNLSDLASVPTALTNLGLNNVNNTSDVNKPVSTAQATADALVASNAAAATSSLSSSTTTSLALKAPLASPALTGVPTAPTAAALTNNTQLSTTAYADAAVSTLSGTTTTALALKAPLASPALTGVPTAPTATAGTNTTQIASTAFVASAVSASGVTSIAGNTGAFTLGPGLTNSVNKLLADASYQEGYIGGLTLSTAGSSATFGIAIGVATDSTNSALIKLSSAYTKTTSTWAAGTAVGALDTGTIAVSTWYHVYLINGTSGTDILISLSVSAPTMPTGYTLFRRIGAMLTNGSSQWVLFAQNGDEFIFSAPVTDISTSTLSTTPTLFALSVPPGVQVDALMRVQMFNATAGTIALVHSPDEASTTIGGGYNATHRIMVASVSDNKQLNIRTNTSKQVRAVSSAASTTITGLTYGYIDTRGRFN
jgi:hypothetical protein